MREQEYNVSRVLATLNIRKSKTYRRTDDPYHHLPMYGTIDDPLFLAVDVAKVLDYSVGHSNEMMRFVSEYDKVKVNVSGHENLGSRGRANTHKWFVTEYGLYEICMRSSKPVAYDFRKSVKDLLHNMRINGQGNIEDWFNNDDQDELVREWESINQEREDKDEDELSWEDFLRSKGYTDDML